MTPLPGTDSRAFTRFVARTSVAGECWLWTGEKDGGGYGRIFLVDRRVQAHRFAWTAFRGPISDGINVLHNCPAGDNPACVNPDHLWLGTQTENIADMDAKGRRGAARGERHGSCTHPEAVARGDRNGSRLHPERLARGDRSGPVLHPETRPRGDRHGSHTHPERVPRGEKQGLSKLNDVAVRVIRLLASRGVPNRKLAAAYGVRESNIRFVVARHTWRHVV